MALVGFQFIWVLGVAVLEHPFVEPGLGIPIAKPDVLVSLCSCRMGRLAGPVKTAFLQYAFSASIGLDVVTADHSWMDAVNGYVWFPAMGHLQHRF